MLFSNDGGVHELLIMFTLLNVDGQLNVGVRCKRCLRALHLCRALDGPWMGLLSGLQDVPLFCAGVSDPTLFFCAVCTAVSKLPTPSCVALKHAFARAIHNATFAEHFLSRCAYAHPRAASGRVVCFVVWVSGYFVSGGAAPRLLDYWIRRPGQLEVPPPL